MSLVKFVLLFAVICQTALALPARVAFGTPLDQALDDLYNRVTEHFAQNPWFKNSSDPDLNKYEARNSRMVQDYAMPERSLFKNSLKSYCVLMESPNGKKVKNPGRFGLVNFTQVSGERRFFVYDVASQSIIHNIWTAHGASSRFGIWYSLKDTGLSQFADRTKDAVLLFSDNQTASLFSNRVGSNQSSVGMAIADTETYFSSVNKWTALRLNGVDGDLNSQIRNRAVVLHEWAYNGESMRYYHEAPLSEGCPMLPTRGFYQGVQDAEIAKIIMNDVLGAPILFYHERFDQPLNERTRTEQLGVLKSMKDQIAENLGDLSRKYAWSTDETAKYQTLFQNKINAFYSPLIDETYRYFKTKSQYYGVEPKNEAACRKALGI